MGCTSPTRNRKDLFKRWSFRGIEDPEGFYNSLAFPKDCFFWNYDTDMDMQEEELSERVGRKVDLVTNWNPKC